MCDYCGTENPLAGAVAILAGLAARHAETLETSYRAVQGQRDEARAEVANLRRDAEHVKELHFREMAEASETLQSKVRQLEELEVKVEGLAEEVFDQDHSLAVRADEIKAQREKIEELEQDKANLIRHLAEGDRLRDVLYREIEQLKAGNPL